MQNRYNPPNVPGPYPQAVDQRGPYPPNSQSIQDPRAGYVDPRNIERRTDYINERPLAAPEYNVPSSHSYQTTNYAHNAPSQGPYPNAPIYGSNVPPQNVPSQYSNFPVPSGSQNFSNNPAFVNQPENYAGPNYKNQGYQNTYQQYPPGQGPEMRDPNSGLSYSQGFPQQGPYDSRSSFQQFPSNLPVNQGFANKPPQSHELGATNAYKFYEAKDKNLPPQHIEPEFDKFEVKEPTRDQLENADLAASGHPFNRIFHDIGTFVLKQGINLDLLFRDIDREGKNVVRKRDFIALLSAKCGLIKMGVASGEEIEQIADIFDFFNKSYVYYLEFCKKVQNPDYRLGGPDLRKKIDPEWREKTYKLIAEAVVAKGLNAEQIFQKYDSKKDGQLRLSDFKLAFTAIPTKLNPQEIGQIADEFDPRHEGIVFYQRFLNTLEDYIGKKQTYEDVVKRLEKFCNEKSVNLETKIQSVDPRDTKVLTKEDFLGVLRQINFSMNPLETQTFIDEITKSKEGFLDLRYLLQRMPKPKALMDLSKIYEKIKNYIKVSKQTLTQVFAKFDKNGDGSLGPYEFSQALGQMGISDLSSTDITVIIQDLDKDKDGSISVSEFADKLGMQIDLVQTAVSHEFFRKISRFLKNRGQTIQEFFLKYDDDRNNSLSKQELAKMLAMLNLNFDQMDIEKLYNELDANRDGRVTFMEFSLKFDKSIAAIEKKDNLNKQKLQRYLKGKHPKDVFRSSYNPDTQETIFPVAELRKGINSLGLNFTDSDIDHIIDDMTQGRNYAALNDLNNFFAIAAPRPTTPIEKSSKGHWAQKWLSQIREHCRRQKISSERLFMNYCEDRSGKMTMAELGKLLTQVTVGMSDDEKLKLGNEFRKDGRVIVSDLVLLIDGKESVNVEHILNDLRTYFATSAKRIEEVFSVDRNGDIYRAELAEALKDLRIEINMEQLTDLMIYLNPDIKVLGITSPSNQKVNVTALASILKVKIDTSNKDKPKVSPRQIEQKIINGIYQKIAECINTKKLNIDRLIAEEYDKFGTNKISVENFGKLIDRVTDRAINIQNIKILIIDLDNTNSGFIKYQTFLGRIQEGIIYNSFAERLLLKIKRDVTEQNINLSRLFSDPSGYVSFQELSDSLNRASLRVDKEELRKLCSGIDTDDNGKISYKEFIQKVYAAGEPIEKTSKFEDYNRPANYLAPNPYDVEKGRPTDYRREDPYGKVENPYDVKRPEGREQDYWNQIAENARPFEGRRDPYDAKGDFYNKDIGFRNEGAYRPDQAVHRIEGVDPRKDPYDLKKDQYDVRKDPYDVRRDQYDVRKDPYDTKVDPYDPKRSPYDVHKDPYDPYGPRRDPYDINKSPYDVKKDPYEQRIDPYNVKKDAYDLPKDPYDTKRDPYDLKRDPYDTKRDPYDARKEVYDARRENYSPYDSKKDLHDYRKDPYDPRRETYDARRDPYEAGRGPYENKDPYDRDPYRSRTPERKPIAEGYRNEAFYRTDTAFRGDDVPKREPYDRSAISPRRNSKPLRGPKQHWARSYIQIIQEYAEKKQMTPKKLFQEMDIDHSNSLTPLEFANALEKMGVRVTKGELQILMEELDTNQDGRISLTEFEKVMGKREIDERIEAKLEEFREIIRRERIDLRRLFMAADRDRSNYLSYDEFVREIGSFYPKFSRYDLEEIARYLDINHDGRIFYTEFIGRLMTDEIEEINLRVADFVRKNAIDLQEAFREFDYRDDKCLSFDQMLEIVDKLHLPLSREESMKFLLENPLHRTRDNRFSYIDLLERLPLIDELGKIYEQIRKTCQERMIKVNEIFQKYDVNNEQALNPKMFFEAFSALGGNLRSSEFTKLLDSLPKAKDGKVLYKEFIKKLKPPKKNKTLDLYGRLKKEIQAKNLNFLENLKSFDTYGDKMISKTHLKEILSNNSITITEEDLEFIWSEFDKKKTNLINYEDLFNRIKPKYKPPQSSKPREPQKEVHWAQRYLDQIQQYLKANNIKIKELFAKFDKDHSNSVSAEEFTEAIREIRVDIPYIDMQKLIGELVSKADGQISLTSFEKLFPEYLETEKILDKMYYTMRKMMNDKRLDLKTIFSVKDREMQGYLTTAEFLECIRQINPDFSAAELRLLADTLDPRRSNRIYYQDFSKKIELGGIELVNMKVREFLLTSRISFVRAFESSLHNDYFLPSQSIRTVLDSLNLPLKAEEITMLIHDNNLSRSQDGRLSVKDLADRIGVREHFPEPRPTPQAIYEKIRKMWQDNRVDPIRVFREFDYEKDLFLTRSNFTQAMVFGNTPLTNIEIDVLWEVVEKSKDGRISAEHFIRLVNGIDSSTDAIFLKIFNYCDQNRVDLGQVLMKFDSDNDRQVTMFEMENAIKSVKMSLTDHEYKSIFSEVDRGRSGRVYISDFMNRVMKDAPRVDLSALRWAIPMFSSILQSLNDFKLDAITYFRRYNIDRDGLIHIQDFRDALYKLGIDPANSQSQRLVNSFQSPNKDSIRFKDFEWALKNLGKLEQPSNKVPSYQPIPNSGTPQFRVLDRKQLEDLYSCLDYISTTIKNKKVTVANFIEGKFPVSIKFDEIRNLIKFDLKIAADDEVIDELCLLLDSGKGFVPRDRLIDALSGVRIDQITNAGSNEPSNKYSNDPANNRNYDPHNRNTYDPYNKNAYDPYNNKNNYDPYNKATNDPLNRNLNDPKDPRFQGNLQVPPQDPRKPTEFSMNPQISPRSIMKQSVPPSLKLLNDYLLANKMTLANLLGRDTGTTFPKSALVNEFKKQKIMKDTEINDLVSLITVQGDKIDLTKLSSMLSDLNKPNTNIRMDPYLLFRESLKEKQTTVPKLFGNSPTVHKDAFMKSCGVLKLSNEVLLAIVNDCKAKDPLQVDLKTLMNYLEGKGPVFTTAPPMSSTNALPPRSDPSLLSQLNRELERAGVSAEEMFSKFDIDSDGVLSMNEFIEAFKSMRTQVPDNKLAEAFAMIDTNNSKTLSINEIAVKLPGARGNIMQRMNTLDLGKPFEEEVKQIFELLDKDKDGSIDYSEIVLGIKAYCILPSQSQTKEIMAKIDRNHNGKIEYEEFKSFIEETVKLEILKEEDAMQDLREKFIKADVMKVGYLTPEQLFNILKATKADITQADLQHLLGYVDANRDGKIDIDEFMLLMTGASPEVFNDPRASAVMFNIRKSRKISPLDFFKLFQGMPEHFLPSFISEQHKMKKNLPSSGIVPTLDPSGLHFRDINPIASKSRLGSLTFLKQNPVVNGGYLTLELASGISIPDASIVQRNLILKRFVRIAHWTSLTQKFLANSIHIEAQWRANLEDRWTFEMPNDKEFNIFVARIGNEDPSKIFLVFEFVIVFCKENTPIEMSCGFTKVSYQELMMRNTHKLDIHGGTPDNEQNINQNDIRTFRSGWRHALKMTGLLKIGSFLQFSIKFPIKCSPVELGHLESLPEVAVMNKQGLTIIRIYREYFAEMISRNSGKNFSLPNLADPFITQFPNILDCPDTWNKIITYWNSVEFSNILNRNRNDATYLAQLQALVNRLYSAMHTEEFCLDNLQPTRFSFGVVNNKVELNSKRMDIITKAISNTPDNRTVFHTPFDISEIASKKIIDTDFLMSKKVRSMSRKLEKTMPSGFDTQGRRNSRGLSIKK